MDLYLIVLLIVTANAWNYDDQDQWPEKYCGKSVTQSPINIDEERLFKIAERPLHLKRWNRRYNGTIVNNGHTIMVELSHKKPLSVSGAGLVGTFNFAQFHFHWASEHTFNRERKALEVHFVTYNSRFNSFDEALQYANGVTVLGVLYDISENDNEHFNPILENINALKNNGNSKPIKNFRLLDLIPNDMSKLYSYSGSLTTPACNDGINWIVFKATDKISRAQVEKFARINDEHGKELTKNYRAIQPLNNRTVFEIDTVGYCC